MNGLRETTRLVFRFPDRWDGFSWKSGRRSGKRTRTWA